MGLLLATTIDSLYVAEPKTAGPTQGGSFITISGAWSPQLWTPVVSLQGMVLASTDWIMSTGSLVLKVPPGPGCSDAQSNLIVYSKCGSGSGVDECGIGHNGTVERLSLSIRYDPPKILSVEPQSANFGDGGLFLTLTGSNFGNNMCANGSTSSLPSVMVSTTLPSQCLPSFDICVCRLG